MTHDTVSAPVAQPWRGVMDAYRAWLDLDPAVEAVTLSEGNTPLVPAPEIVPGVRLWLKLEGLNPTGSFKDRGMTVAVSQARARGARVVICASTGNTAAAAAAYGARAGLRVLVVIPAGAVALGKLAQALAYGAEVLALNGNFDDALAMVRDIAARRGDVALVNSVNPFRIEGQKTAAFEVVDQLGHAPDVLALPVGNAGNITAYHLGFDAYRQRGRIDRLPRLLGFQASGAAPLVRGTPVDNPETVATAIRIGHPASAKRAEEALRATGGTIWAVSDAEILEAWRLLARRVGILAEPASAAPVAGLLKMRRVGYLDAGLEAVAVLTGNGLKDPDTARREAGADLTTVDSLADLERMVDGERC
jgi:threonine synthase